MPNACVLGHRIDQMSRIIVARRGKRRAIKGQAHRQRGVRDIERNASTCEQNILCQVTHTIGTHIGGLGFVHVARVCAGFTLSIEDVVHAWHQTGCVVAIHPCGIPVERRDQMPNACVLGHRINQMSRIIVTGRGKRRTIKRQVHR